jgi:hypothetical protein
VHKYIDYIDARQCKEIGWHNVLEMYRKHVKVIAVVEKGIELVEEISNIELCIYGH